MSAGEARGRIEAMLDECEAMWAVSNIPQRKAREMRAGLAEHLREAARDGKPVEAVVGQPDDLCARLGAGEWAAAEL